MDGKIEKEESEKREEKDSESESESELDEIEEKDSESEKDSNSESEKDSDSDSDEIEEKDSESDEIEEKDSDEIEEEEKKQDIDDEEFLKNKKVSNQELNNIFKNNINNKETDVLNIDVLKNNKNALKTKKDLQYYLNAFELLNSVNMNKNMDNYYNNYDYLYPHLDDELLNIKITKIQQFKEFKNNVNLEKINSIEEEANKLCNKEFELAPHQLFIKNFLSSYSPYNGILLYHGLGTGKTCSAIGIAEETREYLKLNDIHQRIIIVASPSVQENFKLQLFDERKLKLVNNIWEINNCAGNNFLKEINMLKNNVSREKVIKIVNNVINNYYLFMGYIEFANLISKKSNINNLKSKKNKSQKNKSQKDELQKDELQKDELQKDESQKDELQKDELQKDESQKDESQKEYMKGGVSENILMKNKLQKFFNNRLIIIDEIHNIRESNNDNANKLVSKELYKLVKFVDNIKLVLMSATPMYNDYREIIYLTNLLNLNDKRSTIEIGDVFNNDGSFVKSINGEESGKELLKRKLNGYVSYVKGDNPFVFPYRILPNDFDNNKSIKNMEYPIFDLNNKNLDGKIRLFDIYINELSPYQNNIYNYIIYKSNLKNYEGYKYTDLQKPLQALNIVYPNKILEDLDINEYPKIDIKIEDLIGKNGLYNVVQNSSDKNKEYKFKLKNETNNIFSKKNIGKYSCKFESILNNIENSEGPIIVYSRVTNSMIQGKRNPNYGKFLKLDTLLPGTIFKDNKSYKTHDPIYLKLTLKKGYGHFEAMEIKNTTSLRPTSSNGSTKSSSKNTRKKKDKKKTKSITKNVSPNSLTKKKSKTKRTTRKYKTTYSTNSEDRELKEAIKRSEIDY